MKTAEYVKQFKLDKPNYNFNREKFMEAFGQEFKDRIEAMITACKKYRCSSPMKIPVCHQRTAG